VLEGTIGEVATLKAVSDCAQQIGHRIEHRVQGREQPLGRLDHSIDGDLGFGDASTSLVEPVASNFPRVGVG
jgi:hypothetical protein